MENYLLDSTCQMCFPFFFFQRTKNCFRKQLPNKVTISQILFQKYSIQHDSEHHCHVLHTQQDKFRQHFTPRKLEFLKHPPDLMQVCFIYYSLKMHEHLCKLLKGPIFLMQIA